MLYVDERLCTGCGLCVDVCAQEAITLVGNVASIDEARCMSCGRCVDMCLTEAIINVEIIPGRFSSLVPVQYSQSPLVRARPSSFATASFGESVPAVASPASQAASVSRLDVAQKLLSGLFSVVAFALARKGGLSTWSAALKGCAGNGDTTNGDRRSSGCPSKRRARGSGQFRGRGRGSGGGRGQNAQCRNNRRNRTT